MSCARPSTIVVFPTPGSPIRTGLFFVRRDRICMTRSISCSRPITGSSLDSRASCVRLRPNWSSTSDAPSSSLVLDQFGRNLTQDAREQLDDLLAHAVEVGAELLQ